MNTKNFWDAVNDLSSSLFKVYSIINKLADNQTGYCYASNESMAKFTNKHPRSISRDISELIELGYLFSIELKDGFITKERRLYTAENIKTYMQDKKNIDNLLKTFSEEIEGTLVFFNERNPHEKKHKNITSHKNVNGTNHEIVNGANHKIVNLTYTNNNLSKSELSEEPSDSDSEKKKLSKREKIKILLECEEIELDYAFITELSKKYNYMTIVELVMSVDKKADNHGAYLRQIIKQRGLDKVKQSEPKKEVKVEVPQVEEVVETKKEAQTKEEIEQNFLSELRLMGIKADKVDDLDTFNKKLLNDTLRRAGYELFM